MTSENRSDKKPQTICACAVEAKSEMEFQKEIRKNIDKNEIGTYISTVGKIKGSLIHGFYGNTI